MRGQIIENKIYQKEFPIYWTDSLGRKKQKNSS